MSPIPSLSRRASLLAVLALVVAACSGGDSGAALPVDTTVRTAPSTTTASQTTASSGGEGTASTVATDANTAERPAPNPDREIAPDFTLELGSGSTFVLSEETRPVFMVFWAEW